MKLESVYIKVIDNGYIISGYTEEDEKVERYVPDKQTLNKKLEELLI